MVDTHAVLDDITSGHHDDDLGKILQAVFNRAVETEQEFVWKIKVAGDEWTRNTVSLAELAFAEQHTGVSYVQLDPVRYAGHLVALIVAHFRAKGMTDREAVRAAARYTSEDLTNIVSVGEAVSAPKDKQAPSTPS